MYLLLNDLHISANNISEFKLNISEAIGIARDKNATIIIGGDLFMSRVSQTLAVMETLHVIFSENSDINFILEAGNHDKVDQKRIFSYCHIFNSIRNVDVVDLTKVIYEEKFIIGLVSYFPEEGMFEDIFMNLNYMVSNVCDKKKILYIHQGINGGIKGKSHGKELSTGLFEGWDNVLVGHYHDRNRVSENIMYVGASRQHNFGEDEEKGYTLIDNDGNVTFIKNKVNRRYVTLEIKVRDINDELYDKLRELNETSNIRLIIRCKRREKSKFDKSELLKLVSKIKFEITDSDMKEEDSSVRNTLTRSKDDLIKSFMAFADNTDTPTKFIKILEDAIYQEN